jgi:hypothetical protein
MAAPNWTQLDEGYVSATEAVNYLGPTAGALSLFL